MKSNSKKELKHCQAIPYATNRIKRTFIHTFQQKIDTEKSKIISATVKQEAQHFKKSHGHTSTKFIHFK